MEAVRGGATLSEAINASWPSLLALTAQSAAQAAPQESNGSRRPATSYAGPAAKAPRLAPTPASRKPEWRYRDGNQDICFKYNDGTCTEPCPQKRLHICAAPGCRNPKTCPGARTHPECVRPRPGGARGGGRR